MTQEAGCGCVAVPSAPVRRGLLVSLRVSLLVRVPLAAAALVGAAVQAQPAVEAVRVVDDRGRSVVLPAPPARIVSLLPSLTETVCALGACARLVGVDRHSSWPAAVTVLPRLGGLEDTQVERLVALRPDVVLAEGSSRAIERLESLGLRVVALSPRSLEDGERTLRLVGALLGDEAAGARLWAQQQSRIERAAARVPAALQGRRVYFEVAAAPFAAGEASFVGQLLARLGLRNIVPAALGPFPHLNPEFVVRADPDVVMASARALAEMPARPGWRGLRALAGGQACGFASGPWDTLVRPGPRLAEGAEAVADCLASLPPAALAAPAAAPAAVPARPGSTTLPPPASIAQPPAVPR
jgi:iron complex transport system substrate-binding protein